jgi:hypothetical protein
MPLRAVAFATDGVEHFLEGVIKTDTQDFLGKMEGFAVQGVKGMNISSMNFMLLSIILGAAQNHQQRVSTIRADIRNEISEGLSKSTSDNRLISTDAVVQRLLLVTTLPVWSGNTTGEMSLRDTRLSLRVGP